MKTIDDICHSVINRGDGLLPNQADICFEYLLYQDKAICFTR